MKQERNKSLGVYLVGVSVALILAIALSVLLFLFKDNVAFFNPAGSIAMEQRNIFLFAMAMMMIVVVPVFVMLFLFAWKFRESNKKAVYRPTWDGNRKLEALWWGIPIAIIAVLASVTWVTSHSLDPFKPIAHEKQALQVQVVALEWKWLFIYENQGIASVNELHIPVDRPVKFTITSDAPMNSFWIPKLGSQIYAMAGMSTELNLIADKPGIYEGVSANISGEGFADMKFSVLATSQADFDKWTESIKKLDSPKLSTSEYKKLSQKSVEKYPLFYSSFEPDLYDSVVHSYMKPTQDDNQAKEAM